MAQILSNAEENTLVRWISRLTITGFPPTPIGHEWIYRFQKRHPELKTCYSRQLESNRAKEATPENIQAWFDAFQARLVD